MSQYNHIQYIISPNFWINQFKLTHAYLPPELHFLCTIWASKWVWCQIVFSLLLDWVKKIQLKIILNPKPFTIREVYVDKIHQIWLLAFLTAYLSDSDVWQSRSDPTYCFHFSLLTFPILMSDKIHQIWLLVFLTAYLSDSDVW